VERQTGRKIEALEPPNPFPKLLSHVWSAFITLSSRRTSGFNGPDPITFQQILSWKELTNTPTEAWEIEAIIQLDSEYLRVANG